MQTAGKYPFKILETYTTQDHFKKAVELHKDEAYNKQDIQTSVFFRVFNLEEKQTEQTYLIIKHCNFQKGLTLPLKKYRGITFINCDFHCDKGLDLSEAVLKSLSFVRCKGNVAFNKSTITTLAFENSKMHGILHKNTFRFKSHCIRQGKDESLLFYKSQLTTEKQAEHSSPKLEITTNFGNKTTLSIDYCDLLEYNDEYMLLMAVTNHTQPNLNGEKNKWLLFAYDGNFGNCFSNKEGRVAKGTATVKDRLPKNGGLYQHIFQTKYYEYIPLRVKQESIKWCRENNMLLKKQSPIYWTMKGYDIPNWDFQSKSNKHEKQFANLVYYLSITHLKDSIGIMKQLHKSISKIQDNMIKQGKQIMPPNIPDALELISNLLNTNDKRKNHSKG